MNDGYRDSTTTILVHAFRQAAFDFCQNEEQSRVFVDMFKDRLGLEKDWLTQKTYDLIIEELQETVE